MNQIKTLFVVSLLLTCMYVPCIAAAGNNEGLDVYDAQVDNIEQVQAANVRTGPAGIAVAADAQAIRRADRNDLRRALVIYRNDKTPENQQMLVDAAKDHLLQMLDLMIERLELLKEQIEFAEANNSMVPEGASENLDRYILRIESYKPEVESADTPDDLMSVARSINQEWRSIRREILYYTKYLIAARIDAYIEKAGGISDRMDVTISELEDEGVDTTNLRQNLDKFNEQLDCVEENYELAETAVSDDEIGSAEVRWYIQNANLCIRSANYILRDIFNELRALEYETVNGSADEPANESDSGTDEVGDGDTDASGNETESETDDGEVE